MPKGHSEVEETKEQLETEVQSLRRQKDINRIKMSEAINMMVQFMNERIAEDHIVNPEYPKDKKSNPWIEQKKCSLL